ncbi:NAD(P)H-binding protein [Secundilactobacillus mixtipabuli]|uniref:NAD(P)-binding domain-containing protein n=1 Tax=Secundilactobacillus mixtipabuli TaxID=1435342 RepID=A0A1Z5IEF9_9LACO|nr:NAD(P)H-binding protein [Secundilactobacillus mixtipabuli]GAW99991.1 hypothetical protein IWT30_01971 [Secundilactobacillus mixtipabuli]
MTKCLILGIDQPVAQLMAEQLTEMEVVGFSEGDKNADFYGDARKAATYMEAVKGVDVIYSDFVGMDVDWKLEAVFTALRKQQQTVRTVMRSVAGIDQEVDGPLTYAGITDVKEFLKQQRYGIKIVDEAEMPYTVLRPIIDDEIGSTQVQLINEGQPVPVKPVSAAAFAQVVVDEIQNGTHVNQSIAVVGK